MCILRRTPSVFSPHSSFIHSPQNYRLQEARVESDVIGISLCGPVSGAILVNKLRETRRNVFTNEIAGGLMVTCLGLILMNEKM
jgi:hypothetical protein